VTQRPYIQYSISQLTSLAETADQKTLFDLQRELQRRNSSAARKLLWEITAKLNTNKSELQRSLTTRSFKSHYSDPEATTKNQSSVKVLTSARQKLLDLTRRNRLISFKAGDPASEKTSADAIRLIGDITKSWKAIVAEEQTREILVFTQKEMDSAQSDMERMRHERRAANTDVSIPGSIGPEEVSQVERMAAHISLGGLISPLPQTESIKKLVSIFRKANTLESSTGDSALFLAFGFLDWEIEDEPRPSKVPSTQLDRERIRVCSPILLCHVTMERFYPDGGGDMAFRLSLDVDQAQDNPCLREKLKQDLRLDVPSYDPELHPTWQSYVQAISQAIARKSTWKIHPTICLGFFNFAKYRMWRDLDPEVWPSQGALFNHPVISVEARGPFPNLAKLPSVRSLTIYPYCSTPIPPSMRRSWRQLMASR
jgi:hypothetical protein